MDSSKKASIYCRVSTEEQAKEGFSIAAQKKTLTDYCNLKGWEIVKIYVDEGISGKDINRPQFRQMLKDAADNLFQIILVWKINRFSRKTSDLLNSVEYLRKYNVNLVSYSEQFDASTPSGKLMLSMLGSIGEFERDNIVENIRAGMTERAEQGLFNGGCVLGYDLWDGKLIINDKEAHAVKKIFDFYLSGYGYSAIKKMLIVENIKTKNNCEFHINSIKRILKNPIYAGYITYNKTRKFNSKVLKCEKFIVAQGTHEPIIRKEDFEYAQQIMNSKKQMHTNTNCYILTPILKCPSCGGRMTGHTGNLRKNEVHYRYYVCLNYKNHGKSFCMPNSINADKIEDEIIDYLCRLFNDHNIIIDVCKYLQIIDKEKDYSLNNELNILTKELSNKKLLIQRYIKLFESNPVNAPVFEIRLRSVDNEIKAIENRIDIIREKVIRRNGCIDYNTINMLLANFKELFAQLDNTAKKRLISSVIKEVNFNLDRSINKIILNFIVK